jgi:hypothetical protein
MPPANNDPDTLFEFDPVVFAEGQTLEQYWDAFWQISPASDPMESKDLDDADVLFPPMRQRTPEERAGRGPGWRFRLKRLWNEGPAPYEALWDSDEEQERQEGWQDFPIHWAGEWDAFSAGGYKLLKAHWAEIGLALEPSLSKIFG